MSGSKNQREHREGSLSRDEAWSNHLRSANLRLRISYQSPVFSSQEIDALEAGFKAGWDARDEEMKILKEQLDLTGDVFAAAAEEAVELKVENKRLRAALEKIAALVDDVESYEIARQALKEERQG